MRVGAGAVLACPDSGGSWPDRGGAGGQVFGTVGGRTHRLFYNTDT